MKEQLIRIHVYCEHEGLETGFVQALHDRGLIKLTTLEEEYYLTEDVLPHIEKLARMHYDLDINMEGLEAISHLLERIEHMQRDMRHLNDRLHVYEFEEKCNQHTSYLH